MTTETTSITATTPTDRYSFTWLDSADLRVATLYKLFASGTSINTQYGMAFMQMMNLLTEELQYARKELEDARRELEAFRAAQEKRE